MVDQYTEIDNEYSRLLAEYRHLFKNSSPSPYIRNGMVVVPGTCVSRQKSKFDELPFKFGVVGLDFDVQRVGLTSLVGMPISVKNLWLMGNELTSLVGLPVVKGNINLTENKITSLNGIQSEVKGFFGADHNQLSDLVGGPDKVNNGYYVYNNPLTSLEGMPISAQSFNFGFTPNLPLLRIITCDLDHVSIDCDNGENSDLENAIGSNLPRKSDLPLKQRLWKLQQEMIALGYEGNAKW
jgi:hypothetical protein